MKQVRFTQTGHCAQGCGALSQSERDAAHCGLFETVLRRDHSAGLQIRCPKCRGKFGQSDGQVLKVVLATE